MTDSERLANTITGIETPAAPSLRRRYLIPVLAVSVVLAVAGLARFAHFDGAAMFFAAVGAAVTGGAFACRAKSTRGAFIRSLMWGWITLLVLVLTFAVRLSETVAEWMLDWLPMVSPAADQSQFAFQAARLAWSTAFACIGSIAAFVLSAAIDLKKYHTFMCIRLLRTRVINYLVVLAVAGSVAVLIIVLAVLWGFERDLTSRIRGTLAPVSIEAVGSEPV